VSVTLPQLPRTSGVVLYRGPSMFNREPIIAIAIMRSDNAKTGNMVQTFILRPDAKPTDAVRDGTDSAICGECQHRRDAATGKRTCYVNVGQSVNSIHRAFLAGNYPVVSPQTAAAMCAGRRVRLGAYGDPAMVPDDLWRNLISRAHGHTGYTHQWRTSPAFRDLCMASVDSDIEAHEAWSMGWRTFRVRERSDDTIPGEVTCPASKEGGMRTQCERCLLCSGNPNRKGLRPGVVIIRH
jgi:hypothetical protein